MELNPRSLCVFDLSLKWEQLLKSYFSDSFWSVSESWRVWPLEGVRFLHIVFLLGFLTWERKRNRNRNPTTSGSVHTHRRCVIWNLVTAVLCDFMFNFVFHHPKCGGAHPCLNHKVSGGSAPSLATCDDVERVIFLCFVTEVCVCVCVHCCHN